jgi:hypothetical protein
MSSTTIGVLLIKALSTADSNNVTNKDSAGLVAQYLAS